MGFDQYHEPAAELSAETRTFARMIASLTEEAEAIGWYEQRMALEPDPQAKAIMANAQGEEFKHFGMDLEFLTRRSPRWRDTLKGILFQPGDIVKYKPIDRAEYDRQIAQVEAGTYALRIAPVSFSLNDFLADPGGYNQQLLKVLHGD